MTHDSASAPGEGGARPARLQLSRKKGFSLQAHSRAVNGLPAVKVSRPTIFGNPWTIRGAREAGYSGTDAETAAWCCALFREWLAGDTRSITRMLDSGKGEERVAALRQRLPELCGHNLACWCSRSPCHADVLLELANGPICDTPPAPAARQSEKPNPHEEA